MMKIIHLTDLHLVANSGEMVCGVDPYAKLQQVAEAIQKIGEVDAVIITGDITNHNEYEAYLHADHLLAKIGSPIYWLQGNHDFAQVMLQVANRVKIRSDKSFLVKETKFILLQSVLRDEADLTKNRGRGWMFDYELSFLQRELEVDNFEMAVVALHHPPLLTHSWIDKRGLENRDLLVAILEKYPKVKVVLYGHQHLESHEFINNIHYISSPPVSFHYDPNGTDFSLIPNRNGYGIITLDGLSNVTFEPVYM